MRFARCEVDLQIGSHIISQIQGVAVLTGDCYVSYVGFLCPIYVA